MDDVSLACGVERVFIEEYATSPTQRDYYNAWKLSKKGPKRKGEFRVVFEAKESQLAHLHRSMSMVVSNSSNFAEHVQGFMKKRSTRTNAKQHLGAKVLLHADIKGFFDAITTEQVRTAFVAEGTSLALADTLARACTIEGVLRQGTRCSPSVANLVCHHMDHAFLKLASAHDCTYTRYADDLTFSGDDVPQDASVRAILQANGFELRDDKCSRQFRGRNQYVTGLTVSDATRPRLPRRLKHRLRLVMYFIKENGLEEHWKRVGIKNPALQEAWLKGMLRYAGSIEPDLVVTWEQILCEAFAKRDASDREDDLDLR